MKIGLCSALTSVLAFMMSMAKHLKNYILNTKDLVKRKTIKAQMNSQDVVATY